MERGVCLTYALLFGGGALRESFGTKSYIFQSKEWDNPLAKYRAAFDPEDFEFEVGFEMDGFPDEQVYLLEMEDDEDDDYSNYGNYGGAQFMEAMYGQMNEQTRAAYMLQAQQAADSNAVNKYAETPLHIVIKTKIVN